jgi:predicted TIM-barrel fold metal-dependent hydrolase
MSNNLPIIDCHTHVFPSSSLGRAFFKNKKQSKPTDKYLLGLERFAKIRKLLPESLNRGLEISLSTIGQPVVMLNGSIHKLISSMNSNSIGQSVVIAAPPLADNDWLLGEILDTTPDRFIPVCTLPEASPDASDSAWPAAFKKLAAQGARGFKIHPNMDDLCSRHDAYQAMFQVAQSRGLFIILHTGNFSSVTYKHNRPADPKEFAYLFKEYPEVKVCLAHMNRDRPEDVWTLMNKYSQLYTDTSWQTPSVVSQAVKKVDQTRILLGSDWPLLHPELQADALNILRQATKQNEFTMISRQNPRQFLM